MIDLIPAIDIRNGSCVRLVQGDLDHNITVYSKDPVAMAARWYELGAKRLHLVDLDGARSGRSVNQEVITEILSLYGQKMAVDLGGGLRKLETIERYLKAGLRYAVIGTAAVTQPGFLQECCSLFPGAVIVSLDARDGKIATDGWEKSSAIDVIDIAGQLAAHRPAYFLYTDISRDGMLCGVNIEATSRLARATPVPVIASGGVKGLQDVAAVMEHEKDGVSGVILGKALYEGALDFSDAVALVAGSQGAS